MLTPNCRIFHEKWYHTIYWILRPIFAHVSHVFFFFYRFQTIRFEIFSIFILLCSHLFSELWTSGKKRVSENASRLLSLDFFPLHILIVSNYFVTFSDVFGFHGHRIRVPQTFLYLTEPLFYPILLLCCIIIPV